MIECPEVAKPDVTDLSVQQLGNGESCCSSGRSGRSGCTGTEMLGRTVFFLVTWFSDLWSRAHVHYFSLRDVTSKQQDEYPSNVPSIISTV